MADDTTEIIPEQSEAIEDDDVPEGLTGLEASLYKDFKFRISIYEGVLNTDDIIMKGFRLDLTFVEKVMIDELLFSKLPRAVKRKNKLQSHEDLGKIYEINEEGKAKKDAEKEELFDKLIEEKTLGGKSTKDDEEMFADIYELTKKAMKKKSGFSRDDFYRFAKNRASDPELIDIYKDWFDRIFSSAAMIAWEAVRLRETPEVFVIKEASVKEEAAEPEVMEEKAPSLVMAKIKLALVGTAATFVLISAFYFSINALLVEEATTKQKEEKKEKIVAYKRLPVPHLCGKKWAANSQNDVNLLAKVKPALRKKYDDLPKSAKKVYYPLIQGPFEPFVRFKERVYEHKKILGKCGYKVVWVEGVDAELLEKEKLYLKTVKSCAEKPQSHKKEASAVAARSYVFCLVNNYTF